MSPKASERDEGSGRAWIERATTLDVREMVSADESGSNIVMAGAYARAPKGWRAYDVLPGNRGRNAMVIASLRFGGIAECLELERQRTRSGYRVPPWSRETSW